jgi:hypothetical protein
MHCSCIDSEELSAGHVRSRHVSLLLRLSHWLQSLLEGLLRPPLLRKQQGGPSFPPTWTEEACGVCLRDVLRAAILCVCLCC